MRERYEYVLELHRWRKPAEHTAPPGLSLRPPEIRDLPSLAELMLKAYRDTIDDDGETLSEAVAELQRYLTPSAINRPLLEPSVLVTWGGTLVSACLLMFWGRRDCPSIAYVMSHSLWKRRGLATCAVAESLAHLASDGHLEVRAIITKGNVASERLFLQLGFAQIGAG